MENSQLWTIHGRPIFLLNKSYVNSGNQKFGDPQNSGNFFEKMTQKNPYRAKNRHKCRLCKKIFQKFDMFLSLMNKFVLNP